MRGAEIDDAEKNREDDAGGRKSIKGKRDEET
jgi:hypothetical protein